MIRTIDGERGAVEAAQLEAALRPNSRYAPVSALVAVEQTANMSGGAVWPLDNLQEVAAVAKSARVETQAESAGSK